MSSTLGLSTNIRSHSTLCYISVTYIVSFNAHDSRELEKYELAYMHFCTNSFAYPDIEIHKDSGRKPSLKTPFLIQTPLKWGDSTFMCKEWILIPHFTTYTKISSKLIIDLNIRAKTVTILEENIRVIHDLGTEFGTEFLDMPAKV